MLTYIRPSLNNRPWDQSFGCKLMQLLSRSPCDLTQFYSCFYDSGKANHYGLLAKHMVVKQIHSPKWEGFSGNRQKHHKSRST